MKQNFLFGEFYMTNAEIISSGNACLGIEFGSTRIKAVLINDKFEPVGKFFS